MVQARARDGTSSSDSEQAYVTSQDSVSLAAPDQAVPTVIERFEEQHAIATQVARRIPLPPQPHRQSIRLAGSRADVSWLLSNRRLPVRVAGAADGNE